MKLTKNELRDKQHKLAQLEKYLPTLQLKKAMLQAEVQQAALEIEQLTIEANINEKQVRRFESLFAHPAARDLIASVHVEKLDRTFENIAGVEIPIFNGIEFAKHEFLLFDRPLWLDSAIEQTRDFVRAKTKIVIAREKKAALKKELREVSIRVNLFEKVMIPRTAQEIRKIRVFLGDQELCAVAMSKVAKQKILRRK